MFYTLVIAVKKPITETPLHVGTVKPKLKEVKENQIEIKKTMQPQCRQVTEIYIQEITE